MIVLYDGWIPEVGLLWDMPLREGESQVEIPILVKDLILTNQDNNAHAWDEDKIRGIWEENLAN